MIIDGTAIICIMTFGNLIIVIEKTIFNIKLIGE